MPLPSLNPVVSSFRPTGKKVLARRIAGEKEVGGIILPETRVKLGLAEFKVLAVGPKNEDIQKGDTIFAPGQLGYPRVNLPDGEAEILPHDSVFAVSSRE